MTHDHKTGSSILSLATKGEGFFHKRLFSGGFGLVSIFLQFPLHPFNISDVGLGFFIMCKF